MQEVNRTITRKWDLSDNDEMYTLTIAGEVVAQVYENEDGPGYLGCLYYTEDVYRTYGPYNTLDDAFEEIEKEI